MYGSGVSLAQDYGNANVNAKDTAKNAFVSGALGGTLASGIVQDGANAIINKVKSK
ncbi:MAG: hypothetical protein MR902_01750 [Campylobacter sp.]|nr:hypothetical protein [Campylobacter sp.]